MVSPRPWMVSGRKRLRGVGVLVDSVPPRLPSCRDEKSAAALLTRDVVESVRLEFLCKFVGVGEREVLPAPGREPVEEGAGRMGRREFHQHEPAVFPEDAANLREDPLGIFHVMERDDRGDAIERSIGVRDRPCPAFEELDGGPSSTAVRHFFRVRLEDHDLRTTACEPLRCGTRTATEIEEPDSGSRSDDFTEDLEVCQSLSAAPPPQVPMPQAIVPPPGSD